ncbi:MAG: dephospho-CoA kinase [Muribaculum sp.]|nr:dephospho-CoA kinase [Muribaculum sp.]
MKLIVISGGIGSGKSVVSHILSSMGMQVYDCDARAKQLMDADIKIIEAIARDISSEAITPQLTIDRNKLASVVFSDSNALQRLNTLVHASVRDDIRRWISTLKCPVAWIETAIAHESGIIDMVDEEWHVTAPDEIRIQRVMRRNNISRQQVLERINAQQNTLHTNAGKPIRLIVNDDIQPVLPQIISLLRL